ncbi:MAG TPA: SDR family oxidoreductase [Chthoniobacterales bacterium]
MEYYNDCTVLITGASSGIGREFALQLAPHAANIIIAARRLDRLEALKTEIAESYPDVNVFTYGIDLAQDTDTASFLQWLAENRLKVDFLINNAGLGDHGPFESANWDRIEEMLAVNIAALTKLTHSLLPQMLRTGEGAILNVSSVASLVPVPYLTVYAATKAYVTSFSEGLRAELRGTGVSVTALCPGPVPTEFGQQATRQGVNQQFDMSTPGMLSVAAATVAQAGLKAVARDRARVVPGAVMFIGALVLTLLPIFLLRPLLNLSGLKHRKSS